MEYHERPSPAKLSSRHDSSFSGKHVYDGVFSGSPVKVKTGVDDYREIFRGAGGSIPVLDVSELLDRSLSAVDAARGSKVDYSKIFGGFGDADFGVPYEELFAEPKKAKNISSQETRAPVKARSHPVGSEHVPSAEDHFQSFDGAKQFNVLYNKMNQGCKNGTNGTTHIAQLHAIPGYTRFDEISPSSMTQGGKPERPVLNEADLNGNVDLKMKAGKPRKKALSGPQPCGGAKNTSRVDTEVQKKSTRSGSISSDMSYDGFEIGLGIHSSRVPLPSNSSPNLGNGKSGFSKPVHMKSGVSRSDVSEGADASYSPPYFYEEMDANSAAAASAAAVQKAIEEAQARIKFARELMERKKEGLQNGGKLGFDNCLKSQKKEVKSAERANRSKHKEAQEVSEERDTTNLIFFGLAEHNTKKASQVIPDFSNEKKSFIATSNFDGTPRTESKSAQVGDMLEEPEDGKVTEVFLEHVDPREDRLATLQVVQDARLTALEFKCVENAKERMPPVNENEWREKAKESAKEWQACEESPKQEKLDRGLNSVEGAFKWDIHMENIMSAQHEESNKILKESYELGKCESTLKNLQESEEVAKVHIHQLEVNNDMMELKEVQDWVKIDTKQREVHNEEKMENRSCEVPVREESERKLDEILGFEGNEKREEEAPDLVKCEKDQEEGCNLEENETTENDSLREVTQEKSSEALKQAVNKVGLDLQGKEETEKIYREDDGADGNKNLEEDNENARVLKEDPINEIEQKQVKTDGGAGGNKNLEEDKENARVLKENPINEIEQKQVETFECVDTITQLEIHHREGDEKNMEATQHSLKYHANNAEAVDDVYEQDEHKSLQRTDKTCGKENFEGVEVSLERPAWNGRIMEVNEVSFVTEDTGKDSKAIEDADVQKEENLETAGLSKSFIILDATKKQAADINETHPVGKNGLYFVDTDCNFENKQSMHNMTECKQVCDQENHIEEVPSGLDEMDEDTNESDISTNSEENEINSVSSREERWSDNATYSHCDPENCVEEVDCELRKNNVDIKQSEFNINHEGENYFESSREERWGDSNGIYMEASQGPCVSEGNGKAMEFYQEGKTSQRIDENEKDQGTLTMEGRKTEDTLQKEAEVEKELHRKKEEAIEKEMEKEKERIAVERAIREARGRAFAEARERAERVAMERASAKAQQRLMADAQERLGKACADANDKSATEKASREAKLRAERAAVERATAEARERALEKALSEKAAFKARNQSEKFAAEKFSGASKDIGINSNQDQQYEGLAPVGTSRYSSSSNHAVSHSTERYSGDNGESTQRCKAKLERHQRTAERAAKALAEKNMRDLLAQKEQADRNRLAETLDAEVKRWSSGKERNLRALLSTLQYILGPDSGWQPIPLTDIISTTAVKKAYRKATLFVHPDKLQQRGASIQQKYTCEKVFDLLKEAWNRFSAEER